MIAVQKLIRFDRAVLILESFPEMKRGDHSLTHSTYRKTRSMKMKGRVAIVTGASRGIGREIALGYANQGAHVVVCARDEAKLQQLAQEIRQTGVQSVDVPADVSQETDVQSVIDLTLDAFGRIDVLCNNAAVSYQGAVHELTPDQWDAVIAVNLRGPFLCSRAVLPHMKQQNYGRIVDVSSGSAVICSPGFAAYSASKAGMNALSRTIAGEVVNHDILINAMSPGFLKTDMNPNGTRPPGDAVPTAVFLASLPAGGPNGEFFRFMESFEVIPDFSKFDWTK